MAAKTPPPRFTSAPRICDNRPTWLPPWAASGNLHSDIDQYLGRVKSQGLKPHGLRRVEKGVYSFLSPLDPLPSPMPSVRLSPALRSATLVELLAQGEALSASSLGQAVRAARAELLSRVAPLAQREFEQVMALPLAKHARLFRAEEWPQTLQKQFADRIQRPRAVEGLLGGAGLLADVRTGLDQVYLQRAKVEARRQCPQKLPETLAEFYPLARSLKRRLVLVCGPTNSGKTHVALERLRGMDSGVYLGPLRLLALEVRDTLAESGFPTTLRTGELIEEVEGARFVSSTIEMLDVNRQVDMAIIDEVQMLGDAQRGPVWLQAVLGAPAKELWLLGAPEAEEAVVALAKYLGEEIEIIRTESLSNRRVDTRATSLGEIPDGSAVVAFSRRDVLALAGELREHHGREAAVIYGALAPEVRKEQARRFRSGEAPLVVATDAIGLGLNLPIRSLYFVTGRKWDGRVEAPIAADLVWQIAGRAGRYGFHEEGIVGALNPATLRFVDKTLRSRPSPLPRTFAFGPTWSVLSVISEFLGEDLLMPLLDFFTSELRLAGTHGFRPRVDTEVRELAGAIDERTHLALRDKFTLLGAPVPQQRGGPDPVFFALLRHLEEYEVCPLSVAVPRAPGPSISLEAAEHQVRVVTLYCWLHYRWPRVFTELEAARAQLSELNAVITERLTKTRQRRCPSCGGRLPWSHRFERCDECYHDDGPR